MPSDTQNLVVYLAGEIHSDWRKEIAQAVERLGLPIQLSSPVTNHAASDDCGVDILGAESDAFWKDRKGAGINAIRTRSAIQNADVVVVKFGDKYRQWNAAFDAGVAVTLGKPLVTLHDTGLDHALKEIDAAACATARSSDQVVELFRYITQQS